jgi:arylsulfatase
MMDNAGRNIVLVSIDSLRADHCGLHGYERDTTPNLSALADESVVFENAIAPAAFTEQSMPAIFTGDFNMPGDRDTPREHIGKRQFLPEMLSERGYATAGFTPNPFTSRNFGFSQGFDEFHNFFENDSRGEIAKTFLSRISQGDFIEAIRVGANMAGYNIPGIGNQSIPFRAYEDIVKEWIEEASEPFFLWIFLLEVHSPYRPTPEYRAMSLHRMLYLNLVRSHLVDRDPTPEETEQLVDLYDGTIELTDDIITTLMDDLDEYDPVFVVHPDHGESFGEHDNFGHNEYLYEENIHVPFMVTNTPASGRVTDPISLRQVSDVVDSIARDGTFDPDAFTSEEVVSRVGHEKVAIWEETAKYILNRESKSEQYELTEDPEEQPPASGGEVGQRGTERVYTHLNTEEKKKRVARIIETHEELE